MPVKPLPEQNHLLAALSPEVQRRWDPHLKLVALSLCDVVYAADQRMRYVYFPADAIISVQYVLRCGGSGAPMLVGNEGLLGFNVCLSEDSTPSRSLVQSAGYAYRLPGRLVREEFSRHEEFLELMLRYTQVLITQIAQTAACNRHHSIDQQFCRWLLMSLDRLPHNRLTMTQEFISNMLGVRREGVTQSATKLRDLGVIDYARGSIIVLDRPRLEALTCECYDVVKKETMRLLGYLPQRQTLKADSVPMAPPECAQAPVPRVARRIARHQCTEPSRLVGKSQGDSGWETSLR